MAKKVFCEVQNKRTEQIFKINSNSAAFKVASTSVSVFRALVQYQSQLMAISYHESTSMWSHQKCRPRKIFFDRCRAGLNRMKTVFSQSQDLNPKPNT
ncbi:hypothetical protein BpHYR1_023521 [Brachionus plicatilis]|uniref:Uncharacterized protein n=1 Tax=Brachionus plicatilis TaxID=10195 RepID=A0A3M7S7J4_BRAPC|nr:hypothetical protein BpHYR1_023521 [Brachionus plicatilis]